MMSTATVFVPISSITYQNSKNLAVVAAPRQAQVNWLKIPQAVSIFTYTLEGVGLVMLINNSMAN